MTFNVLVLLAVSPMLCVFYVDVWERWVHSYNLTFLDMLHGLFYIVIHCNINMIKFFFWWNLWRLLYFIPWRTPFGVQERHVDEKMGRDLTQCYKVKHKDATKQFAYTTIAYQLWIVRVTSAIQLVRLTVYGINLPTLQDSCVIKRTLLL